MVWSSTVIKRTFFGNRRVVIGSWDATGAAGGNIATGLKRVESCAIWHKGAAVEADTAVVNATYPLASGNVPVVCTAGDAGYYIAIGL